MPHTTYPPSWYGRPRRPLRESVRRWLKHNEPLLIIYGLVALVAILAKFVTMPR
jgi:hypothetical protein